MFLLYFALWMIYFGSITVESAIFGIVIAALVFLFTCKFLDYSMANEIYLYKHIPAILNYTGGLIREVIEANFAVMHMILSEKEELKPVLVHFHMELQTPTARAFMADSITLTPGTITVSLEDSDYVVHCLDESLAEGLNTSVCAKRLEEMEKE